MRRKEREDVANRDATARRELLSDPNCRKNYIDCPDCEGVGIKTYGAHVSGRCITCNAMGLLRKDRVPLRLLPYSYMPASLVDRLFGQE